MGIKRIEQDQTVNNNRGSLIHAKIIKQMKLNTHGSDSMRIQLVNQINSTIANITHTYDDRLMETIRIKQMEFIENGPIRIKIANQINPLSNIHTSMIAASISGKRLKQRLLITVLAHNSSPLLIIAKFLFL